MPVTKRAEKENKKKAPPKSKEQESPVSGSARYLNQTTTTSQMSAHSTPSSRTRANKSLSFESQFPSVSIGETTRPKSISDSFAFRSNISSVSLYCSSSSISNNQPNSGEANKTQEVKTFNQLNENEKDKYINQLDCLTGKSQLHEAVIAKDVNRVINIIRLGGAIDIRDRHGNTPLHEACLIGDCKIVETLFSLGANPRLTTKNQKNIAHLAAGGNHRSLIAFIVEQKLDVTLFFEPDRDGYLPIRYLNPKMEHYKYLRTFMLCYHKFNFSEQDDLNSKPVSGKRTLLSRLSSGSLLLSGIAHSKYASTSQKDSETNKLDDPESLPFPSNVNIRQEYLYSIKRKSSEIDRELLYIGFRSVSLGRKHYDGKELYKRLIQKYVFANNLDTRDTQKPYTTSLVDIKYMVYGLQKLYDKVGVHEILGYINQNISKREFVIQLHCIYFVKELILSLKLTTRNQKYFAQELKIFLSKIQQNTPAFIKIKRNLQMLYFSDIQPLYNSIDQEMSIQNELSCSPRRHSSPSSPSDIRLINFEAELDKIAAGIVKPDDEGYQKLLNSVSQDIAFLMAKYFVQIDPTNLLNYAPNKSPVIDPGFNQKTGFSNLEPIREIIKTSEKLSIMLAYDILSYELPGRTRVWEFYTRLIERLLEGKATNHIEINCICALIFGQHKSQIMRLSETKSSLSQRTRDFTNTFEKIVQVNANFNTLRKYRFNKSSYPALFLFTRDLTSLNEIASQEDRTLAIGKLAVHFFDKTEYALLNDFLYTFQTDVAERLDNIRVKFLVEYREQRSLMAGAIISENQLQAFIEERLYGLSVQRENHTQTVFGDDMSPDNILAILRGWQTKSSDEKESTLFLQQLSSLLEWNKEKLRKLDEEVSVLTCELQQKIDLQKKHQKIVGLADDFQKDITKTCPLRHNPDNNSTKSFGSGRTRKIALDINSIRHGESDQCGSAKRLENRTPRRFELPLFRLSSKPGKDINDLCLTPTTSDRENSVLIRNSKSKITS